MKRLLGLATALLSIISYCGCSEKELPQKDKGPSGSDIVDGFTEAVPDTISFSNAEFIYNGDDIGEGLSDGWVVKFYTDMKIDDSGAPIGPGCLMQLLLNVRYDKAQSADPEFLPDTYTPMASSTDFSPGTFVNGYMTYIDLPTGRMEMADATFYADVQNGTTELKHDLIDEGRIYITDNGNGIFSINGVLVGDRFTKRHFKWTGKVDPQNAVPQGPQNSTITADIKDLDLTKGLLQDKGDCFYLQDNSYRCYLLFLGSDGIDLSASKPAGTGELIRLEVLVPWESRLEDGVPAGTYTMTARNADTSVDRDSIRPGAAVPGLPNRFSYPYISGSWYISMQDGSWSDRYARIDTGTITVSREEDGRHTVAYDLKDCQSPARSIKGSHTLNIDTLTF